MPTMPRPTTQAFFLVFDVRASSGVVALVEPDTELVTSEGSQYAISAGTGAMSFCLLGAEEPDGRDRWN